MFQTTLTGLNINTNQDQTRPFRYIKVLWGTSGQTRPESGPTLLILHSATFTSVTLIVGCFSFASHETKFVHQGLSNTSWILYLSPFVKLHIQHHLCKVGVLWYIPLQFCCWALLESMYETLCLTVQSMNFLKDFGNLTWLSWLGGNDFVCELCFYILDVKLSVHWLIILVTSGEDGGDVSQPTREGLARPVNQSIRNPSIAFQSFDRNIARIANAVQCHN